MINKIYFDMDGVLADFDSGVEKLAGFQKQNQSNVSAVNDDAMWQAIKQVPHFYDQLELMDGAKEMFDYIYSKYGDKCEILTGIPKPKRGITTAGEDKIAWMHRILSNDIKVNIVYREEKKNYCEGSDCILIDDLEKNIEEWKSYGGTGIQHKNAKETLNIFKNLEDIDLIKRVRQNNDQDAWQQLCEKYKKTIDYHVKRSVSNIFEKDKKEKMSEDLSQEGWNGFVQAVRNYNCEEASASFHTYVNKYIYYAVIKAFDEQLNNLGLTHRPKYNNQIKTVFIDSMMGEDENFDIEEPQEEISEYANYIQDLTDSGVITDKGSYNSTQRAIHIIETLRLLTDENHKLNKEELSRYLSIYRKIVHHNSVKPDSEGTLKKAMDELIMEVDPLEYSDDNDDKYMIKYDGYKENRLAKNIQLAEEKKKGKSTKRAHNITNFYYQHPFSYSELDTLIETVAFSELLPEEDKLWLCNKIIKTASTYYENPFICKNTLRFNPMAVAGRFLDRYSKHRENVAANLKLLQQAMNQMTQVSFSFNSYDEKGNLVPVSDKRHILSPYRIVSYQDEFYCIGLKMDYKKIWHYRVDLMTDIQILRDEEGNPVPVELGNGEIPSAISYQEWNPQKYMSEHLYMGYDKPIDIRIKIKNTDYTILQHWFAGSYKRINSESCKEYDVVEIRTSPSMIVPWALQYGDRVEILNAEIRRQIREKLNGLMQKYDE